MSILDEVRALEEVSPWLRILIYGDPKVGKTVFSAGAPNPLIISGDKGHISLLNHQELRKTKVLAVDKWSKVYDILDAVRTGALPEVETVVCDNITELQKKNLDHLMKTNKRQLLPYESDYKESTQAMRQMIIMLQDLPKHVIITAHALLDKDGLDGHVFMRPALTPAVSQTIVGLVDIIGYMDFDEDSKERTLQVWPSRKVLAGTRLKALPNIIKNPHIDTLFKEHQKLLQEVSHA